MGKLIVIEGACDGIGKSTQYNLLYEKLTKKGYSVASHHFPTYNKYQGVAVEHYLKGDFGTPQALSPYFVHALYATDRAITWHNELKNKYNNGTIILLDRYTTSSIIYQAALFSTDTEKKQFMDFVTDYEYNKLELQKPDNVIFLHAPFELVTQLRESRKTNDGIQNDIHERNLDFMKKVYNTAMLAAEYLNWNMVDCANGSTIKSVEEIHTTICKLLSFI